jgi:hypothetical protein
VGADFLDGLVGHINKFHGKIDAVKNETGLLSIGSIAPSVG